MSHNRNSPKIVIHAESPEPLAAIVRQAHPEALVECCNSYAELPAIIATFKPNIVFTIRFAGTPGFPREALLGPDGPQWISVGGSGVDHLGTWDHSRVSVTNAAGVAADMMAEYVLGGYLHFTLDIDGLRRDQANAVWRKDRRVEPVSSKTLLIIGLGNTGKAIAKRAKAFGMNVIGTKANPGAVDAVDEVFSADELPDLWARCDFVAVCVPLLNATRGLVDKAAFSAMKPGVVLADVSRGGVINENDLIEALKSGKVRGAVLDVFKQEPLPENHQFWQFENVLLSPHCSSVFDGWETKSIDMFCANLARWKRNESLKNQILSPTI